MFATIIHSDGFTGKVALPESEAACLAFLQDLVGGYIEAIPLPDRRYMILHEDAKLFSHIINQAATNIARSAESIQQDDYIAGIAVIVPAEVLR